MTIRKLLLLFMVATGALVAIQCKNAEQDGATSRPSGERFTIVATLEQPVGTKTSLSSETKVLWSAGDQIKVYNASHPDGVVFHLNAAYAGSTKGEFSGKALSGEGPFYAVYPASVGGTMNDSSIAIMLPSVQSYLEGSFGPGAAVSVAEGDNPGNLSFKNVLGGVSFTLTGGKSISGVRLQTLGEEALNGAGSIIMNGNTPVLEMSQRTSDDGTYMYLNGPASASASFCLMIPPGTLEQGFLVEFLDGEGNVMFRSAKSTVNKVVRSAIVAMPELAYEPAYKSAFFTSDQFGVYPSIGASASLDVSWEFSPENCQYAYRTEEDRYVRVQSLERGFYTEITTPKEMGLGETYEVTVTTLSGSTKDSFTKEFKVLQKAEGRVWLVNETDKVGIIQKMED